MTEIERLLSEGFINEDFLKEEIRCDYVIPETMKKAWAIQLDLTQQLLNVCKKLNLRVWATGGTLLGAVRHKGYIPWDDDLDVVMPREDYNKLLVEGNKYLAEPYFIQSYLSEKVFFGPFARIRNSNTTVNENNYRDKRNVVWNNGIFVDIFPLDGVNNSKFILHLNNKIIRLETILLHAYALNANKNLITRFAHFFLHLPFIPYNCQIANRHISRLASGTDYETADKVGVLQGCTYNIEKIIWDKSIWDETVLLPFENIMIPAPKDYDKNLRVIFNDYMSFPPVESRGENHSLEFEPDTPYLSQLKNK